VYQRPIAANKVHKLAITNITQLEKHHYNIAKDIVAARKLVVKAKKFK